MGPIPKAKPSRSWGPHVPQKRKCFDRDCANYPAPGTRNSGELNGRSGLCWTSTSIPAKSNVSRKMTMYTLIPSPAILRSILHNQIWFFSRYLCFILGKGWKGMERDGKGWKRMNSKLCQNWNSRQTKAWRLEKGEKGESSFPPGIKKSWFPEMKACSMVWSFLKQPRSFLLRMHIPDGLSTENSGHRNPCAKLGTPKNKLKNEKWCRCTLLLSLHSGPPPSNGWSLTHPQPEPEKGRIESLGPWFHGNFARNTA